MTAQNLLIENVCANIDDRLLFIIQRSYGLVCPAVRPCSAKTLVLAALDCHPCFQFRRTAKRNVTMDMSRIIPRTTRYLVVLRMWLLCSWVVTDNFWMIIEYRWSIMRDIAQRPSVGGVWFIVKHFRTIIFIRHSIIVIVHPEQMIYREKRAYYTRIYSHTRGGRFRFANVSFNGTINIFYYFLSPVFQIVIISYYQILYYYASTVKCIFNT